ncbi:MAG: GH3 auxin-responsive promoter family protein [Candidatus Woesearchaeota archaeon]
MKTIDFISSYFFAKKAIKDIKFVQEQVLKDIISIAKNSKKGKEGFYNNINSLDDIVNLPIMDFNDIKDNIEEVRNGLPYNFSTFPVKYLFSTSGTTGEAKLIPGTQLRDLSTIKETATMFAYHQNLNYLLKSYFSGKTLLFVAQPIKSNQQIPIMNISGYQTLNVPKLMKNNIAIDEKIIQMQQCQEKDDLIITSALNSNLSHFALTNANAFLRLYEKLINNWDEYVSKTNGKRKKDLIKLKKLNIDNIWPNLSLISAYKSKDNLHHLNLLLNKINKPIFTQEAGFNTSEARITVPSGIHGSYAYLSTTSGIFLGREIKYDNKGNKYLGDFLTADKLTQPGIKIQAYVMTYDLPFLYSTGDEFITGESLGQVPSLSFLGRNKVDNLMNSHTLISDLNQMPYIVNEKLNLPIRSYAVTKLE